MFSVSGNIDTMRLRPVLLTFLAVVAAVGSTSCVGTKPKQQPRSRLRAESVEQRLRAGYDCRHPRLFRDWRAIADLLTLAGYEPDEYSYHTWHNADGTRITLWNHDESKGVTVSRDHPLAASTKKPGLYVDQGGQTIAQGFPERNDVMFSTGASIFAPNFVPDTTGTFFVAGGSFYDYESKTHSNRPILLSAVADPMAPLDEMAVDADPVGLVTTTDRIYLFLHLHGPKGGWPASRRFVCRIYERRDATVRLANEVSIAPVGEPTWRVTFRDFDPTTGLTLFEAEHDVFGATWYLYDLQANRCDHLGRIPGNFAAFLDPHLFERAIGGLHGSRQR